jgi:predicted permease
MNTLLQDLKFAQRQLRKSPGFTVAAVLTLALAIGANAVVFGVMDGLILRPLNVPHSENLYGTEYGTDAGWQSYPNYLDLRDRNRSFEELAAFNFVFAGFDPGNDPSASTAFGTTTNYFDVLGIKPYLGRFYHSADEHGYASTPFVVLTYAYWHTRFQDDRSVVGRTVLIDKHPMTVIGVAQPGFHGTLLFVSPDYFIPIGNLDLIYGSGTLETRGSTTSLFESFGHLKPGVTPAQAVADVNSVGAYLAKTYPKEFGQKSSTLSRQGLTSFRGPAEAFVAGLMLLAGLILLAACANLGSLFAARAADRSREVALRLALGSSRGRILRGLLTEAVLVSLGGGAVGLLTSVALLRRLATWRPIPSAPVNLPVTPDAKLYVVALVLALVSGFLFGIIPVRQVLRTNPYEIIKAGSTGNAGRRFTVRDVLLVVQIAICGLLVTASLVAARGMVRSLSGHYGFEPHNAMVAGVNLGMAGYEKDKEPAMQRRMIDALRAIPGVEQVGLVIGYPPLAYGNNPRENIFRDETADLRQSNAVSTPFRYDVSPGYFEAAETNMLSGRSFNWDDGKDAPRVAVVNREFATKIFGSVTGAIGRLYKLKDGTRVQVVGVVEDGKYLSLTEDTQPAMFLSFLQSPSGQAYLIVRSHRDPVQLSASMRSTLQGLEAGLPVDIQTWNQMLETVLFPARMATMALGVLGLMGAMLAITGIFGMAAYSVSKRMRELGVRMALGAQRTEILQAALGRPFKLLVIGSASGLILGVLASRLLAFIVYGATPRDPLVLGGVVLAMMVLGMVATWIPAQRALSVSPVILLREE